jgi:hypothetical protein
MHAPCHQPLLNEGRRPRGKRTVSISAPVDSFLLRSHSTPTGRHVEIDGANFLVLHPRCSQLAIIRPPSTGISAFAHSTQTACVLGPFRPWLWCETSFRHLPKRMFTHTGGDRGKAECGASAEGWRERPALALFLFWIGTRSARRSCFSDSGPPSSPPVAPVEAPRKRGFVFLASSPRFFVLAVTFGIPGAGY